MRDRLRIAWVTPRVRRSAIGRESVRIARGLAARGHAVELIGSEAEPTTEPLHASPQAGRWWGEVPREAFARDFDIVVVNVGDNYPLHAGIFEMDAAPTLGVFHDFYLHNLFNGWRQARNLAPEEAERILIRTYGQGLAHEARRAVGGEMSMAELAPVFPMTEWVARRCAGALAHADFYQPRLAAACPGPVDRARMPVPPRGGKPLPRRSGRQLTVLTVGLMNPNKCADAVIGALAASPSLKDRTVYRLAGPIEEVERRRLEALAQRCSFGGLAVLGPVSDKALTAELEAADIICCLRKPVLEGSSGSAIEALLAGRPTIVADAGFYGELPDDLVAKVPAGVPRKALTQALERLAGDEPLRRKMGASAQAWARRTFSLKGYLDVLEPLMSATQAATPWLKAAGQIGAELEAIGLSANDPAAGRIGEVLTGLAEQR
jgi:glycosyltransferase involved in cell wall biosynthesis